MTRFKNSGVKKGNPLSVLIGFVPFPSNCIRFFFQFVPAAIMCIILSC